ncbi:MAG: hypothetical protein N3A72_05625 [bacterium]|nr:hypothetical protein [bacterium]
MKRYELIIDSNDTLGQIVRLDSIHVVLNFSIIFLRLTEVAL